MPENFPQYLILLLIGLLFAKDYLLPPLLRRLGLGNEKNEGKKVEKELESLKTNHLHTIGETLERIERRLEKLDEISEGIIWLKAKINGGGN